MSSSSSSSVDETAPSSSGQPQQQQQDQDQDQDQERSAMLASGLAQSVAAARSQAELVDALVETLIEVVQLPSSLSACILETARDIKTRQAVHYVALRTAIGNHPDPDQAATASASASAPLTIDQQVKLLNAVLEQQDSSNGLATMAPAVRDALDGLLDDVASASVALANLLTLKGIQRQHARVLRMLIQYVLLNTGGHYNSTTRMLELEPAFLQQYAEIGAPEQPNQASPLALTINGLCDANVISYPFKRHHLGSPLAMFERLQHLQPADQWRRLSGHEAQMFKIPNHNFVTGNFLPRTFLDAIGTPAIISTTNADYDAMDVIADLFQEEARLLARRQDQPISAMESWRHSHERLQLITKLLDREYRLIAQGAPGVQGYTSRSLREFLYENVKECTQFKPSLGVVLMRHFGATRVLDFSAGWGDRLIAAMAAGVARYVGVDPNTGLRAGHDAMIAELGPHASGEQVSPQSRFTIVYEPFQTARLPEGEMFDMVFTSPPFFDFEIYTQLPGQSVLDHPRQDAWLVNFLCLSLAKAWSRLVENGHMLIHLSDVYKTKVVEPMSLFIQSHLPGARFLGVIASQSTESANKPRPVWAWKKTAADHGRVADANRLLTNNFRSVHQLIERARELDPYVVRPGTSFSRPPPVTIFDRVKRAPDNHEGDSASKRGRFDS
ncbi:hypothetical protein CAOG_01102 [Capsaspora owczarzaki ATCC 30864]|uniref:hypothetical protein n=1 Tax=Capsaspora owczarzaki (strain ATCC 30864) TaxID=595528 RepID=UPI0001FE6330|nr:hypothetical protein CAOG_01102 [Capsaspora owczarzaki ATCC 30864]|eukprot:XP_004365973.1 hypothetical protein CAOG_01102 [Capsaspora owczarzaki ATCC 30864]